MCQSDICTLHSACCFHCLHFFHIEIPAFQLDNLHASSCLFIPILCCGIIPDVDCYDVVIIVTQWLHQLLNARVICVTTPVANNPKHSTICTAVHGNHRSIAYFVCAVHSYPPFSADNEFWMWMKSPSQRQVMQLIVKKSQEDWAIIAAHVFRGWVNFWQHYM